MINDQLKECKGRFTGEKQPFLFRFTLEENEMKNQLALEVKNQLTREIYELAIDEAYILERPDLAFCFEAPQDLFYTLMELFNDLRFEEGGALIFEMKLNATKLKKKVFTLNLIKSDIPEQQALKASLEKFKQQMKLQLEARELKIRELSKNNQEHESALQELREEIKELRREQETLALENKRQYFKLSTLSKQNQLQNQEIVALKKNLEFLTMRLGSFEFHSFLENPHWHHFATVRTEKSLKIIRKDNDAIWYSFVYNIPLQPAKINGFKIKQTKTNFRNVMYGIGTRQAFGKDHSFREKESIAYNAYNGNLWENGISRKGGPAVYDGQVITMEVNLSANKVSWTSDNLKLGRATIPEAIKKKDLFLCLHSFNIEDQLELLLF